MFCSLQNETYIAPNLKDIGLDKLLRIEGRNQIVRNRRAKERSVEGGVRVTERKTINSFLSCLLSRLAISDYVTNLEIEKLFCFSKFKCSFHI